MPYKAFKMNDQYCVYKLDADDNKTGDSLGCHATETEANDQVKALYANERNQDEQARSLFDNFWQGLKELFIKRRIKDVDSWDGSASQFASTADYCDACLINENTGSREDWVQSKCKLPVRGPGDSKDTYVRQAVHVAAQRFGQTEASQDAKDKARRELVKAYKEMDEEPPESLTRAKSLPTIEETVFEAAMMKYPEAFFHSTFMDRDGSMFAVLSQEGKLYRSEITEENNEYRLNDWVEVEQEFTPVETRTKIRQMENGRFRWFSISATSVLNRSGEIDSRELFDSFIAHIEETQEYPIRQFYHQGTQFRTGQADFVTREDNVLITSGLFDDTELAQREIEARQKEPTYWGESIGYLPTTKPDLMNINGVDIPVYRMGIFKEISTLPQQEAANLFTMTTQESEVKRMKGQVWEAFRKLWDDDEDKAKEWLEANVNETNRAIEKDALITRDKEEGEEEQARETEETQEQKEIEIDDNVVEAVVNRMKEVENEEVLNLRSQVEELTTANKALSETLERVNTSLANIITRLEALEIDDDEKRRKYQEDLPKSKKQRVTYKPRQNEDGDVTLEYNKLAKERMPRFTY